MVRDIWLSLHGIGKCDSVVHYILLSQVLIRFCLQAYDPTKDLSYIWIWVGYTLASLNTALIIFGSFTSLLAHTPRNLIFFVSKIYPADLEKLESETTWEEYNKQ